MLAVGSGVCLGQQIPPAQPEGVEQKRERLRRLDEERQSLLEEIRRASGEPPARAVAPGPANTADKAPARSATAQEPTYLETVVVTGTRSEQAIGNIAGAVTIIKADDIQLGRKAIGLEESLRRVPGVKIDDELGGTPRNRISIRGIGTRSGAAARGLKVLVDGIPKNNAGGSAQDMVNLDLGSAERIEVIKGPSSVLYGNQSGGAVNIITKDGKQIPDVNYSQTLGSFGLSRERFEASGRNQDGKLSYYTSLFRTDLDGYRDLSKTNSTGFTAKLRYSVDDRSDFTLVSSYDRSFAQAPGSLTAAQFAQNPRQASAASIANKSEAVIDEFRLGAIYRRELLGNDQLEVTGYYTPRHLGPFQQTGPNRVTQDFTNRGGGVKYLNMSAIGGFDNRITVGADYQNTPITTGNFVRSTGSVNFELEEHATTFGVYLIDEFNLLPNLMLSAGGRFDSVKFTSDDLTKPLAGESARTFRRFTPKLGATYRPLTTLSIYASYSEGFDAPLIGELRVLPTGQFGFNKDLDPEITKSFEIGARGEWWGGRGTFEVALYRQAIKNFISPFGASPLQSTQNVGEARQTGFEIGSRIAVVPRLSLAVSYTYSNFVFKNFNNGISNFTGNRLPGVPKQNLYTELQYQDPSGWYGGVEYQHVGSFFVNDANTVANASYELFNLRLGYKGTIASYRVEPFFSVNNVFGKSYSALPVINEGNQRFFNPLPMRNAFAGVTIKF